MLKLPQTILRAYGWSVLCCILVFAGMFLYSHRQFLDPQTIWFQCVTAVGAVFFSSFFTFSKIFLTPFPIKRHHFPWIAFFLTVVVFIELLWVNQSVLLSFFNSADEFSCCFFSQCLLEGKLWSIPHPLKEFFATPHIGDIGGKWFSVYPPGWPAILAWAQTWHGKNLINPILTSLTYGGILCWGRSLFGRKTAILTGVILAVSPFFIMTGAAYYSHPLCLFLSLIFFVCAHQWEKNPVWIPAFIAGNALGFGLAVRYLTTVAWSTPVLIHCFLLWKQDKQTYRRGTFTFIFTILSWIFLHALYNFMITGHPFDAPNHYLHPHERLGFIPGYTPFLALEYFFRRIYYLMDWTPPLFIFTMIFALFSHKKCRWEIVILWAALLQMVAYLFYYSWGGNQYGPRYYYEAYPWLVLVTSHQILRWIHASTKRFRAGLVGGITLSLCLSLWIFSRHIQFYHQATQERKAFYTFAESHLEKPALVFVKGFIGKTLVMDESDTVRNHPFWRESIVYAHDQNDKNLTLLPYFPNHHYYFGRYDQKNNLPIFTPMQVETDKRNKIQRV